MKEYKVKVEQSQGRRSWKPGDKRMLSDTEARALIAGGLVEPIKKRTRKKK